MQHISEFAALGGVCNTEDTAAHSASMYASILWGCPWLEWSRRNPPCSDSGRISACSLPKAFFIPSFDLTMRSPPVTTPENYHARMWHFRYIR